MGSREPITRGFSVRDSLPLSQVSLQNLIHPSINEISKQREYHSILKVKLNQTPVYGIIDSGNTAGNAMSTQVAKQIFGPSFLQRLEPTKLKLCSVKKGEMLEILGRVKTPIALHIPPINKTFLTRPYVIKGIRSSFNISGPFLAKHKIDQLHSKKCLQIDGKLIKLRTRPFSFSPGVQEVRQSLCVNNRVSSRSSCFKDPRQDSNTRDPGRRLSPLQAPGTSRLGGHSGDILSPGSSEPTEKKNSGKSSSKELLVNPNRKDALWVAEAFGLGTSPVLQQYPKAKKDVHKLLMQYLDVFSKNEEYGYTNLVEHAIHTDGCAPIRSKLRPLNPVHEISLKEQLQQWLKEGVIEPSSSPWASAVLAVPKKNGKTRWVIDYRNLNTHTIKDAYPLPNIADSLSRLAGSKIFSAIDGAAAFHVVRIRPQDKEKTAFITPFGLYQFKRMPFGLCNAPATYSRLVQKVLEGIPTSIALPYLDDCAIHSPDLASHINGLALVFEAHRKAGLKIQPAKCQLFRFEIDFLGHKVTGKGITPLPSYVSLIKEWPEPTTEKEVRTFMGKVAYYRKFIQDFSAISAPLYELLCRGENEVKNKNRPVHFGQKEKIAFQRLKLELCQAPILAYPDFDSDEPFIVDTDFSKDPGALGGVLSQVQDGEERVICYGARKLVPRERNYSSNKGEIMGVIHFLRQWKYYLQHRPFILRTDHQALKWIRTMEEPQGMILRWLECLANYDFNVEFRKGKKHGNADHLSRCTHAREPTETEKAESEEEAMFWIGPGQTLYPNRLPTSELVKAQSADPNLLRVIQWVKEKRKPDRRKLRKEDPILRQYCSIFETLILSKDGVLMRRGVKGEFHPYDRICLPDPLQKDAIKVCHESAGGHMGVQSTQARLNSRYYFPGLFKTVEAFVKNCLVCQQKTGKQAAQRHTLVSLQEGAPFQKIAIDLVGPIRPASRNGCEYILTAKDCFTRWLEAYPLKSTTSKSIVDTLEREYFSRYGLPETIHSDQGANLTSDTVKEVCEILNIQKTETPAYNPKSNPVERSHRDLAMIIKAVTLDTGQDWEDVLPVALMALRTTRNRQTGITPFYATYGQEARLPLDLLYEHPGQRLQNRTLCGNDLERRMRSTFRYVRKNLLRAVERSRAGYTGKLKGEKLIAGDLVWLFTPRIQSDKGKKFSVYWTGPWKVTKRISDTLFEIETYGDWNSKAITVVVSIDRLKRYNSDQYEPRPGQSLEPSDLTAEDVTLDDEFSEQTAQADDLEAFRQDPENEDLDNLDDSVNDWANPPGFFGGGGGVIDTPAPPTPTQVHPQFAPTPDLDHDLEMPDTDMRESESSVSDENLPSDEDPASPDQESNSSQADPVSSDDDEMATTSDRTAPRRRLRPNPDWMSKILDPEIKAASLKQPGKRLPKRGRGESESEDETGQGPTKARSQSPVRPAHPVVIQQAKDDLEENLESGPPALVPRDEVTRTRVSRLIPEKVRTSARLRTRTRNASRESRKTRSRSRSRSPGERGKRASAQAPERGPSETPKQDRMETSEVAAARPHPVELPKGKKYGLDAYADSTDQAHRRSLRVLARAKAKAAAEAATGAKPYKSSSN